jgi:hypothetical protein
MGRRSLSCRYAVGWSLQHHLCLATALECLAQFVNAVVTFVWFVCAHHLYTTPLYCLLWTAPPLHPTLPSNVISVNRGTMSVDLQTTEEHVKPRRLKLFRSRIVSTVQRLPKQKEVSLNQTAYSILTIVLPCHHLVASQQSGRSGAPSIVKPWESVGRLGRSKFCQCLVLHLTRTFRHI